MSSGTNGTIGGTETPVRVYVGSQDAQMVPVKVLEYSIRQRTELARRIGSHPGRPGHAERLRMADADVEEVDDDG